MWWKEHDDSIEFLDGPDEDDSKKGPPLHHFRTHNPKLEETHLKTWCTEKNIKLPIENIRIYGDNGELVSTQTQQHHRDGQTDNHMEHLDNVTTQSDSLIKFYESPQVDALTKDQTSTIDSNSHALHPEDPHRPTPSEANSHEYIPWQALTTVSSEAISTWTCSPWTQIWSHLRLHSHTRYMCTMNQMKP